MINRDEVVKIYDLANLELTENVDDLYEKYNTVSPEKTQVFHKIWAVYPKTCLICGFNIGIQ